MKEPNYVRNLIKLRAVGSRDLAYTIKGLKEIGLSFEYAYQNKTFLSFANGLNDFSVEIYDLVTSPTYTWLHKGGIINSLAISASVGQIVTVKPEIFFQDVTVGSAHPSGATFSSDPGTTPKTWYDCSVTISGSPWDGVTDFHFAIHNNLHRFPTIRSTSGDLLKFLAERQRDLTGELTLAFMDNTQLTNLLSAADLTLAFAVGSDTYTFNNAKWDSDRMSIRPTEIITQRLPFTAKTLTIT
jgi:hypothetical protein